MPLKVQSEVKVITITNTQAKASKCRPTNLATAVERFISLPRTAAFTLVLKPVVQGRSVTRLNTHSKASLASFRWLAENIPKIDKMIRASKHGIDD